MTRTSTGTHRLGQGLCAITLAALQACAINPLVRYDMPPAAKGEAMTLDRGKAVSDAARRAYQTKLYEQVGYSTSLSSGLITLGALVTALSVAKVHRDAILGSTLIGGTAFALGTWNLDKRRLVIYQAAVAAFNCADRAAAPLNMRVADFDALKSDLEKLTMRMNDAAVAIGNTDAELLKWTAGNAESKRPYAEAIAAAQTAQTAAVTAHTAGHALYREAAGISDRLIDAVRRIDQQADAALTETVGDLSAVTTVIASLAGIAGSFAPGSNVEAIFTDALKKSVGTPGPKGVAESANLASTPPGELIKANAAMNEAVALLAAKTAAVQGRVQAYGNSASRDSLADCGIGEINLAMSASPGRLTLAPETAATSIVVIRGGKAPYSVHANGVEGSGITVKGPDRLGSTFEVKVPATFKTRQTFDYQILDSSSPTRTLPFAIEITAAPPATKPELPAGEGKTNESLLTSAASKLVNVNPFKVGGIDYRLFGSPMANALGGFTVTLSCATKPQPPPNQDSVRQGLLDSLSPGDKAALAPVRLKFVSVPSTSCVSAL